MAARPCAKACEQPPEAEKGKFVIICYSNNRKLIPFAFQVQCCFWRNCKTSSCVTVIMHLLFTQFWFPRSVFEMSCHSFWLSPGSPVCFPTLCILNLTAIMFPVPSVSSGLSTKLTPTTVNIFKLRSASSPCNFQFGVFSFLFCFPFHFYILFNLRFWRYDVQWW